MNRSAIGWAVPSSVTTVSGRGVVVGVVVFGMKCAVRVEIQTRPKRANRFNFAIAVTMMKEIQEYSGTYSNVDLY